MNLNDLLPVREATARAIAAATTLNTSNGDRTRTVGLWDASGYVLAEDVTADRDQPPFVKSMMDGFAFRHSDAATQGSATRLVVVGESAAGRPYEGPSVGPGEAVAIMTGAPLPDGTDSVHMVERTTREGGSVVLHGADGERLGNNVSQPGSNVTTGDVVVERGRVIESLTAGVIASVGRSKIDVFQRPRVTVMTTGDELVSLEQAPGPHQIRDSNRRTLFALLEREWCRVVDGGIVEDTETALRAAVRDGLKSDVLVLSGGVSAGVYDLVADALREEGVEIAFHGVRMKPGKPMLMGTHPGGLVFGLPGNPVSTYVTALMVMVPALRVLGRRPSAVPWTAQARLKRPLRATRGRAVFEPATVVVGQTGELEVEGLRWRGSSDQTSYARANALIWREAAAEAAQAGEQVTVVLPQPFASW